MFGYDSKKTILCKNIHVLRCLNSYCMLIHDPEDFLTLNQRVIGSSPISPTNTNPCELKRLAGGVPAGQNWNKRVFQLLSNIIGHGEISMSSARRLRSSGRGFR